MPFSFRVHDLRLSRTPHHEDTPVIPQEVALTEEGTNKSSALQWLDIAPGAQTERRGDAGPVRFARRRTRTGRLSL
jgi:hypothetical protein